MITIIQNRLYAKYTYFGIEPETKHNVRYAHGHLPPNYPMPAIRREVRFIPYKDEVWTGDKTTLCLAVFKPEGFGYTCERYWFNT